MENDITQDILGLIINRAPNSVRGRLIIARFKKYPVDNVREALQSLVDENRLSKSPNFNIENSSYRLKSYENIPIRKYIKVGDTFVPRVLQSDEVLGSLEDINEAIENLADYASSLGKQFASLVEQEREKYWANVITLLGMFIAIFSLIIVSLPRIEIPYYYSFWQVIGLNTAQILPVAVILGLFVFILWLVFRKLN